MIAKQTVTVSRMGYSSEALGQLENGKTVFIEGGAPGDIATIEIIQEKPSFARARIVSLDEPSPLRVTPACPQVALCGGCSWAHLSYEAQRTAKRENVVATLVHGAHFDKQRACELVGECMPSKRQWGYRNKLELGAHFDDKGEFVLGFHQSGTHDVITTKTCPLVHKPIEKAPKILNGALRYAQGSQDLGIFRVNVRASVRMHACEIALWTKPGPFPRAHVANTLKSALDVTSIVRILADPGRARSICGVEVLEGAGYWEEKLADIRFLTSAPSFFQVNTAQAEKLVAEVLEGLGGKAQLAEAVVADLYAGGGTFSIPLALAGAKVVAVESAGSSVRDLRRNATINGVDIKVVGGDAARELPQLGKLDALVVDPPRAGLAKGVIESIANASPAKVAYVSCDPATWARDVGRFEACGYRLERVQPVDLFPQTYHVECVALMSRTKA